MNAKQIDQWWWGMFQWYTAATASANALLSSQIFYSKIMAVALFINNVDNRKLMNGWWKAIMMHNKLNVALVGFHIKKLYFPWIINIFAVLLLFYIYFNANLTWFSSISTFTSKFISATLKRGFNILLPSFHFVKKSDWQITRPTLIKTRKQLVTSCNKVSRDTS